MSETRDADKLARKIVADLAKRGSVVGYETVIATTIRHVLAAERARLRALLESEVSIAAAAGGESADA